MQVPAVKARAADRTDTHLVATPVSTRVNAPNNNDAKLIEPFAA